MKTEKSKKHRLLSGKYEFIAEIYEGGSGFYEMAVRGNQIAYDDSGNLDIWLNGVENQMKDLDTLRTFLNAIKYSAE